MKKKMSIFAETPEEEDGEGYLRVFFGLALDNGVRMC